jgi:hypothetical protein
MRAELSIAAVRLIAPALNSIDSKVDWNGIRRHCKDLQKRAGICKEMRTSATNHSTRSEIHREIAVTSFRGAKRTDSAASRFCQPLIARERPSITAR